MDGMTVVLHITQEQFTTLLDLVMGQAQILEIQKDNDGDQMEPNLTTQLEHLNNISNQLKGYL